MDLPLPAAVPHGLPGLPSFRPWRGTSALQPRDFAVGVLFAAARRNPGRDRRSRLAPAIRFVDFDLSALKAALLMPVAPKCQVLFWL